MPTPAPLASDGVDQGQEDTLVHHPRPEDDPCRVHRHGCSFVEFIHPIEDRLPHSHGFFKEEEAGVWDQEQDPQIQHDAELSEPVDAARKEQDKGRNR